MFNWNGIGSLFIGSIELFILINVILRTKKNYKNKLIILLLLFLTAYQFFEFIICQFSITNHFVIYLAFAVITFLPPVNLLLVIEMQKLSKNVYKLVLIPAVFFVTYYIFKLNEFFVVDCRPLYNQYKYPASDIYGFFYYLPIVISIIILLLNLRVEKFHKQLKNNKILLFGNLVISLPVIVSFLLLFFGKPELTHIMVSVMCKFAFFYFLSLTYLSFQND